MITLSYGGGKQTIAIVTMILEGKLPRPDMIVMADTAREVRTTFEYMNQVVQPALAEIGLRVEIAGHELSKHDLYKSGDLLLPAFTRQNGQLGKMPTFCSNEWKQRVIRRYLRNRGVTDTDVWLGISLDECERMKDSGLNWYRHVYPLCEIVPTTRQGCIEQIKRFGWPVPHKSRCHMCPNQSAESWKELKRLDNGDFEKAVALENDIRSTDPDVYLHPLGVPLSDAVELSERQLYMFDGCDSGYCFT